MRDSVLDSEKQEDLLVYLANEKKQRFDLKDAQEVYNTKKHAKNALKTLSAQGFVEKKRPGQYKLLGIPPGLKDRVATI